MGNETNNANNFSVTFLMKIISSAISVALTHPLRVCTNEASVTSTFVETIKSAWQKMFKDVPINLARGTLSISFQSIVNYLARLYFGQNTFGRSMGVAGASLAALSITPIEVKFMRNNALRGLTGALSINKTFIYNRHLLTIFAIRDGLFSSAVFGTETLPLWQKMLVLLPCAAISAMGHKLASVEATKDIRGIVDSVPNYSHGYHAAFRDIAYGRITHDAFKVFYPHPKTPWQLAINFIVATGGRNIICWRFLYLGVYACLLSATNKRIENIVQCRFFKPAQPCKQPANIEEKKAVLLRKR